jgi:membrane protease YdiL (CAAX protease family)
MDTTPTTLSRNGSAVDEQHSVARTLVLHLLPGVLILVFSAAVAPLLWSFGFPPVMAVYLASVFVLIPFELGYLIYQARKNGTSLGNIVLYRQPVPKGQLVLLVIALFVWALIIGTLLTPVDFFVKENLFSWLPGGYDVTNGLTRNVARFSTVALLITLVFGLIVDGIAAPVVEEMYFRGYLLPRISRLGAWAPLLNTVLFSLYHFFSPFQIVSRTLTFLPVVYAAWWKRSIYLSMTVHFLFNLTSSIFTLLLILGIFGGLPG